MTAGVIELGPNLKVSARELATNVSALIGMRGSGKSNLAAVMAEGFLTGGVQTIILDYVGIWYSLRLNADGKTASGLDIAILGGPRGDIGMLPTAGALVAEALASTGRSAVLDLSRFKKGERMRFATDFAEAFFHAKKENPGPVAIILEEAQRYIPQKVMSGQERMLGAFEEIAEVGRNYGIGLVMLSQRPQKLNKDVLNLTEFLCAFQMNGVHERKAISEWVQEKGEEGRKEVFGELPSLKIGHAIYWSPRWLGSYGKHGFHRKQTYDAGATPMKARAEVKTKPLDLGELATAMQQVAEEAKGNDPKALRARVKELEAKLAKGATNGAPAETRVVEVSVTTAEDLALMEANLEALRDALEGALKDVQQLERATDQMAKVMARLHAQPAKVLKLPPEIAALKPQPMQRPRSYRPDHSAVYGGAAASSDLGKCERAILTALVQHGALSLKQAAIVTLYSTASSGPGNAAARLRSLGYVEGGNDRMVATSAGVAAVGDYDPLPTGAKLAAYWLSQLGMCERAILRQVLEAYPEAISLKDAAEAEGYSTESSGPGNAAAKLRTLNLVVGGNAAMRASEQLV